MILQRLQFPRHGSRCGARQLEAPHWPLHVQRSAAEPGLQASQALAKPDVLQD
eukprot:CAMPEP_0181506004 /NCGR_PEP_ID=MMETSP1110-20121109/58360_1 /TAXON_ID=174948 /ORGANISM="Symbiodinium sp., Strain CCMP421" /LENGTH=52 /DNA_ID=CAMNT_0023635027 /DNA_START=102 /DNA_END=257 /DNA_ORIENTATION=+